MMSILLLAQAASAPGSPMSYAEMNLADQFAYLSSNVSQFDLSSQTLDLGNVKGFA